MARRGTSEMAVGADGIAVVTIANPPVNALSPHVLISIRKNYEVALRRDDVKAIVITGAKGKFSGGFDINAFEKKEQANPSEHEAFNSNDVLAFIEDAEKPSVAAIDGIALGGGLEIAMACHGRVSTSSSLLGLPELQLGVIPGMGGTQRLPRLVGLSKSLEMMMSSKPLGGGDAYAIGLIDLIVPASELVASACSLALDISEYRRPWLRSLYRTDKLEALQEAREIIKLARKQTKKQPGQLEHYSVCIDVVEEGVIAGPHAGLLKENESSIMLKNSQTSKSLRHFFFAQRATSKIPMITDIGLAPRNIKRVAVIGGGLMGSGISTALIMSNINVILKELNVKFLEAGISRIKANLHSRVLKGMMTQENYERTISLVTGVLDYEEFKNVDMVIEAVIEDVSLKQQIFSDLEKYCSPNCVLATNTSTIDLNLIGEHTRSQERIVGAHFFSPAHVMPLLEIVTTQKSSPQVIVDLLNVAKRISKTPVVVGNCTGFAINRTFFPYTQAALFLVDKGLDIYRIDGAITKFGMPMGPFRLSDLVGFGVAVAIAKQYLGSFGERCYRSMLIPVMLEDERSGEASGKGFYLYDDKRKASPDPNIKKYIQKSRSLSAVSEDPQLLSLSEKDIVEMIFFPVVNEACRVLDEGIAHKSSDIDVASIMGMGFPAYRGGILFWADSLGSEYVHARLDGWSRAYGAFFKPCNYLAMRAAKGMKLATAPDRLVPHL